MPNLVMTSKGLIPRDQLDMREDFGGDDNHVWHAIEYYLNGEQVKRSAEVHILKGQEIKLEVQNG
jgi:hypothetical protein